MQPKVFQESLPEQTMVDYPYRKDQMKKDLKSKRYERKLPISPTQKTTGNATAFLNFKFSDSQKQRALFVLLGSERSNAVLPFKSLHLDINYNINMINLAYLVFFYILVAEVVLFLLLTLPTPPGFKSKLVRAFMGSNIRSSLMWVHLALCVLAGLFFLDLAQTEVNYGVEKDRLRELGNGHVGTEVRMGFLSYQIQRVERNKYITAMLIYASIVLNMYVRMLYFIYKRRGDYDGLPDPRVEKEMAKEASSPVRTSTVTRESSKSDVNKSEAQKVK